MSVLLSVNFDFLFFGTLNNFIYKFQEIYQTLHINLKRF